jgi:hypothetical protein
MRATIFDEPVLEFGSRATHIDPRHGVTFYGPADRDDDGAPTEIRVGMIGTQDQVEGLGRWLERCQSEIPGKADTDLPTLFPSFPGFHRETGFRSRLVLDDKHTRVIAKRKLDRLAATPGNGSVTAAVDLYAAEVEYLTESRRCDVIVCARPDQDVELDRDAHVDPERLDKEHLEPSVTVDDHRHDFHDMLKAKTLQNHVPLQLIRRTTWEGTPSKKGIRGSRRHRRQQDEATRAWNLHTALYYKAKGTPWRLPRSHVLTTLSVGVSFFHTPDRTEVHTAVAQVFNELGEGIVVRGGPAAHTKDDRQPHLGREDASDLLLAALKAYRREHHTYPARVVLHKTSAFNDGEIGGFNDAADQLDIEHLELLWIYNDDELRLFRTQEHAPLRGTLVRLDEGCYSLFTRGTVNFYRTYPGMYVPSPIGLRSASVESSMEELAVEVLGLTKLNWNQSQLDGRLPITLRAAQQVSRILKHTGEDRGGEARYAQYI